MTKMVKPAHGVVLKEELRKIAKSESPEAHGNEQLRAMSAIRRDFYVSLALTSHPDTCVTQTRLTQIRTTVESITAGRFQLANAETGSKVTEEDLPTLLRGCVGLANKALDTLRGIRRDNREIHLRVIANQEEGLISGLNNGHLECTHCRNFECRSRDQDDPNASIEAVKAKLERFQK